MSELYPLKFVPIFKETIWGGNEIAPYKHTSHLGTIGESWEIADIGPNVSVVASGPLAGQTVQSLAQRYKADFAGAKVYERFGNQFPLLIKFINAEEDLSIQVHPDDDLAMKRHGQSGKTEMWYVVSCKENAEIIAGFSAPVSKESYETLVAEGTFLSKLAVHKIAPSDAFLIPAGTVHSIKKGCLLVEIQQPSDITYRISDYGRKDKEGNQRELHVLQAKDAIRFSAADPVRIPYKKTDNERIALVDNVCFTVNLLHLTQEKKADYSALDSFVAVVCTEGSGSIEFESGSVPFARGETILIPAALKQLTYRITEPATLIECYLNPSLPQWSDR